MKFYLVLLLLCACQADERDYHTSRANASADVISKPQGEAVSVSFENLPRIEDNNTNINIGITSQNGASTYKYALVTGSAASAGSSACDTAEYSGFMPLTQTIFRSRLPEGSYLLCAIGKDVAGTTQQMPTTFAWLIDKNVTVDEGDQPDAEELAGTDEAASNLDMSDTDLAVEPTEEPAEEPAEEPTPVPTPIDNTKTPGSAEPTEPAEPLVASMKINTGSLNFSNSETRKIKVYVQNEGTAPLNWRMQSTSDSIVKWLRAEYDGTQVEEIPDDSEDAVFSGTVPAGGKSEAIKFSLQLDATTKKVPDEFLQYKDPTTYEAPITFYDNDNDKQISLKVRLSIPLLELGNESPRVVDGKKKNWQLSLPKDNLSKIYKIYANNKGEGNLSWQVLKNTGSGNNKKWSTVGSNWTKVSDNGYWFLVRKQNKFYMEIKLAKSAKDLELKKIKDGWGGRWNYVIFRSNGGRSYATQKHAGRKYLKVCFEEKTGEHRNKCHKD